MAAAGGTGGPPAAPASWLREIAPLAILLAVGLALRVALSLSLYPAAINQYDAIAYVFQAKDGLFTQAQYAPGYSEFLRIPHLISHSVAFTISIQHLLGLLTAAILWWTVRRLTGSRWLGLIPAAFVVLDADGLLLEHALMSETLFRLLVVGVVAAALAAIDSERPWLWLGVAAALAGAAIWVRYAGLVMVPVLVGWALIAAWPRRRMMLATAGAAAAVFAVFLGGLIVAHGQKTGYYGISQASGRSLYTRVAQFADCSQFDPPAGTEALCQPTDPAVRHFPDWYAYNPDSPALKLFGGAPGGDSQLNEWGRRALLAQPLDYLSTVWSDVKLYFFPEDWTNQNNALIGPKSVSFTLRTPDDHCDPGECLKPAQGIEGNTVYDLTSPEQGAYYDSFDPTAHGGIGFFQGYQRVIHAHGPPLLVLALMSLAGLLAVRGRLARAQWLVTPMALALLVFPVATATYNIRYGIPTVPLFALAATIAPLALRDGAGWIPAAWTRLRARFGGPGAATLGPPGGSADEGRGDSPEDDGDDGKG